MVVGVGSLTLGKMKHNNVGGEMFREKAKCPGDEIYNK